MLIVITIIAIRSEMPAEVSCERACLLGVALEASW